MSNWYEFTLLDADTLLFAVNKILLTVNRAVLSVYTNFQYKLNF
jgi:hypothetical protein